MKIINRLAVVISMALIFGTGAYAQTNLPKVGRSGHITLTQETQVGETLLAPGYYEIRHKHSATGHYMEFTLVTENDQVTEGQSVYNWVVVAKVPCSMQSLSYRIGRTTAKLSNGEFARLNSLEIRGENVEHLF